MVKGVLLDLSGVLYEGNRPVAGAATAVARLREAGLPVRFVTNSTRSPRRKLLEKLRGMGFELADEELFTPARATCDLLAGKGLAAHLLIHSLLGVTTEVPEHCAGLMRDGSAPP